MYQAIMSVLTEGANLNESYSVHVNDGSGYGDKPHKADVDHVRKGVKDHSGEFDYHSDKGAAFKFKSRSDAESFARHVNKSPKGTCYADDVQESVEMPELTEQQIDELSKKLLGSYIHSAKISREKHVAKSEELGKTATAVRSVATGDMEDDGYKLAAKLKQKAQQHDHVAAKRSAGITKVTNKLSEDDITEYTFDEIIEFMATEEYAQLDEVSKETLKSYVTSAAADAKHTAAKAVGTHAYKVAGEQLGAPKHVQDKFDKDHAAVTRRMNNRAKGIDRALNKLSEEDQVDESAQALANKQAELKKLKAQKASGSPLGNVDRDISNARAAIKKLKAQRASGWPLGEDEEPEDLSIEESVERILNEGFTYPGSRSILPASQALHDKAKSSIADIVDTWGHDKMTVQVAQKENGKHVYIAGHGHDKHDTEAFHAHHDQTFRNMGAHKVVNTIHLEGGKIVHKENDIGTDKAHPLYVYK